VIIFNTIRLYLIYAFEMKSIRLGQAIVAIDQHPESSIRAIARDYNVPFSTLQYHLQQGDMIGAVHKEQMRLSEDEEHWIADWILQEDHQGRAPSIQRVRQLVVLLLHARGDENPLGKNWITGFKRRNPQVQTMMGTRIENARFDCATPEAINQFYNTLQHTKTTHKVIDANIWNMDECGTAIRASTNSRVMADSRKRRTRCKALGNRKWVSIIECISALGMKITPLVIFKGASVQAQWFPVSNIPRWHYTHSINGWTSNQHGIDWLKRVFAPQTAPDNPNEYRILICDEHGSHVTVDFIYEAYLHKIQVVFLPPHTSHILQPLNLTVFSNIKRQYRAEVEALNMLDNDLQIKKRHFIECYNKARCSLTPGTIINGFRCTGIVPFDPQRTLTSSQVRQPLVPVTTPPQLRRHHRYINTPTSAMDAHRAIRLISPTTARMTCRKVAKSIAIRDTEITELRRENHSLQARLQLTARPAKRKRVDYCAQDTFATIVEVRVAQLAMEVVEAVGPTLTPVLAPILPQRVILRASNTRGNPELLNMQYNWQIDPALQ
jgi:4-hydroxybenzoate polyprenyltransferase